MMTLTLVTREMMNPREMMKGSINYVFKPRVRAQSQHTPDLKLALSLGLRINCDKNLQTKGDVV